MRQSDRQRVCAEILELAGTLDDVDATVQRLAEWSGRGYPSGGDGTGRGQGGSPTETAVEQRDPFSLDLLQLDLTLVSVRDGLRDVRNVVARAKPVPQVDGEVWCRSHRRVGAREPIYSKSVKSGLCEWCWSFHQHFGKLPTPRILEHRQRGRKVTQQFVDRELGRAG